MQGTQAAGETPIMGSWSEIVSDIFNGVIREIGFGLGSIFGSEWMAQDL